PSTSIAHSCRPMTLYSPQWMNIPNLASCHHCMRRSWSGGVPDCGAGLVVFPACATASGAAAAIPALAAIIFKQSLLDVPRFIFVPLKNVLDGSWSEFHERWILLRRVKLEVRYLLRTRNSTLLRPILLALFFAFATRGTVPDLCIRI